MSSPPEWLRRLTGGVVGSRNFAALGVGQVLFGLSLWGILSVLAHLSGSDDVGKMALALVVVTPTFQLLKFRLRDVLATDVSGERPVVDYLATTTVGSGVAILVSLLLITLIDESGTVLPVVLWMAISRAFEALSQISYGHQQRLDEMIYVGRSLAMRGVFSLVLLTAAFSLTGSLAWGAFAIALANGVVLVLYDYPRIGSVLRTELPDAKPSLQRVWALVVVVYPLGLFSFLVSLTDAIPRLIISATRGFDELGIFASFGYVIVGSTAVTRSLGQAASPRLAAAVVAGDRVLLARRVRGIITIASVMGVSGVVLALLFGEAFLDFFFGNEFSAFSDEFVRMAVYAWMLFLTSGLTATLIAARRFGSQLAIQVSTVLVVLAAGLILIPDQGIHGAVTALLIAGSVRVALSGAMVARLIRLVRPGISGDSRTREQG